MSLTIAFYDENDDLTIASVVCISGPNPKTGLA